MKVQVMRMLLLNNMKFMLRNELLKRIIVYNFFLLSNVLSFILLIIFCIIVGCYGYFLRMKQCATLV